MIDKVGYSYSINIIETNLARKKSSEENRVKKPLGNVWAWLSLGWILDETARGVGLRIT